MLEFSEISGILIAVPCLFLVWDAKNPKATAVALWVKGFVLQEASDEKKLQLNQELE
jgi:hypothetical protein